MAIDPNFLRALTFAEESLSGIAPRLDVPTEELPGDAVLIIGIVRQAFGLYESALVECGAGQIPGALILVRAVVEAAILVRWIELDPDLHVAMYAAEDDRNRLLIGNVVFPEIRQRRTGSPGAKVFGPAEAAEIDGQVRLVRARAVAARKGINPKNGTLLPSLEQMGRAVDDTAIWEAYQFVYRVLSPYVHSGGRALAGHAFEARSTGRHLVIGSAWDPVPIRAIAATSAAVLLAAGSRAASAGFEKECRVIQDAIAEWPVTTALAGRDLLTGD